jgi:poly(hydroxyalkanoate) depolymerase family esterase
MRSSLRLATVLPVLVSALAVITSSEAAGGPASFDRYWYTNSAGTRSYKVFVPPSYSASMPLVVDLHGCGSNADEEARWSRFNELAATRRFFVAYPEQASSANGSLCWNWFLSDNHSRDAGEPSIIAGITRTVMQRWKIDPLRVWVAGISAGGAMSDIMAVTYPDLFASAMVYAGCEYKGTTCTGGLAALPPEVSGQLAYQAMGAHARVVPVFVIQGDIDVVVPSLNAEFVVQQFLAGDDWADDGQNNASISRMRSSTRSGSKPGGHTYDIDSYTDSKGCLLAERWLIHGMGHAWSNATPNGSPRDALLTDPLGPDVTTPTYEFFASHPMPKKGTACFQLRMRTSGLERY